MQILIIDLGSQYTLLIGRRLRELGVRSLILPPREVEEYLAKETPRGIILSGGAASIYDSDSPQPPENILKLNVPILGICLGMHWLVQVFGGEIRREETLIEYGPAQFSGSPTGLLEGVPWGYDLRNVPKYSTIWASHGDSVRVMPLWFDDIGESGDGRTIAAIRHKERPIWGLQFHPEVEQTEYGPRILKNFLDICGAVPDWSAQNVIAEIREEISAKVPRNANCLLAYSGGVDSTILASILKLVLGERLTLVTIDGGQLREGELEEIQENAKSAGSNAEIISNPTAFRRIELLADAEEKRAHFQETYFATLEEYSARRGIELLIQGTLAPDIIESGKVGEAAHIKTHHNLGNSRLKQLHPLRALFKDEVRDLARALGLPEKVSERMPFPGPGLFCRVVGLPATEERLGIVRWADREVSHIIKEAQLERKISQLVVALIGAKTVGVKGDGRSYGYPIVVRAVRTSDFMTAWGVELPSQVRREIIRTLTTHPAVTRVWFDETSKPPATIELE
ncbi:hypothetical protein A2757_03690 [Candidatus Giovannonibacteria bacterium RIFCSPHIGHO2_01_FULL_48_47]|nr:MAG: hypothetical protein A2757_03690 [Candidatus Giovannonibacteria bacterium RIFCSPHIGHO2_01_FULL_48_47]OGF68704.1 MAG: hypothetical protein A3D61_01275 [Candidatus Giovannonibacteria bacterium RIFCSPHIGHO2_02_FULL_48_15]OGF89620.1 MAG: hypothetical protein A3B26_02700 [Candidatus Giovannonibacteria bacterium RIFCSPLOWO2_01_FULL_48_47]OGF96363.1 MAG: hypothetical protein A2613_02265 [Candidatus Giovannonibacteria bacterium RIFOXYD1_FULL_48_21]HBT81722.1 glutamine-hydrolyzing GMP synthase [